jgi:hypothetical protein
MGLNFGVFWQTGKYMGTDFRAGESGGFTGVFQGQWHSLLWGCGGDSPRDTIRSIDPRNILPPFLPKKIRVGSPSPHEPGQVGGITSPSTPHVIRLLHLF